MFCICFLNERILVREKKNKNERDSEKNHIQMCSLSFFHPTFENVDEIQPIINKQKYEEWKL